MKRTEIETLIRRGCCPQCGAKIKGIKDYLDGWWICEVFECKFECFITINIGTVISQTLERTDG